MLYTERKWFTELQGDTLYSQQSIRTKAQTFIYTLSPGKPKCKKNSIFIMYFYIFIQYI